MVRKKNPYPKRYRGRGFLDWVKRPFLALKGPRNGPTKRFQEFLDSKGNQEVEEIRMNRKPVISGVQKALDVLSGGRYSKRKKKLGYDDVYHNYMMVKMKDGKTYRIEKNHVVEANPVDEEEFRRGEKLNATDANNRTLKDIIDTASKRDSNFWKYDPKDSNCQVFVNEVVQRNNIQPTSEEGVKMLQPQNSRELINSLGPLRSLPKFITDVAGVADRVIYGDGLNRFYYGRYR
jgi:hypothetical protein